MAVDTTVRIGRVDLRNPVIVSSGVVGFGREYAKWADVTEIGGITLNGLTASPKEGSAPQRIVETPSGVLSNVGIQNPGVVEFIRADLDFAAALPTVKIVNVAGSTMEEYVAVIAALDEYSLDMYELNTAWPSAAENGLALGTNAGAIAQLVRAARAVTDKPISY